MEIICMKILKIIRHFFTGCIEKDFLIEIIQPKYSYQCKTKLYCKVCNKTLAKQTFFSLGHMSDKAKFVQDYYQKKFAKN